MKCIECGNELLVSDRYWQMGLCNDCWNAYRYFDKSIPLDNPYEKTIEKLKQLIFNTRETIRHILIVDKRPVKGTTKEDCYKALEKLQKLYNTNRYITTSEFLDQIEKGESNE